jgi:hypothetical protein
MAPELRDRPVFQVLEQHHVHWLEFSRDADLDVLAPSSLLLLLLCRAVAVLHDCLLHTPLNKVSVCSFLHPSLLERSQQGLVVNALHTRGREPLRSTSRLLGFTIKTLLWDPAS